MEYSRWASRNKDRLGIDDKTTDKESLNMNNEQRATAVRGLLDKARSNRGEPTEDQKRTAAVNALLGRQPQTPLRPESQALADSIRKGR